MLPDPRDTDIERLQALYGGEPTEELLADYQTARKMYDVFDAGNDMPLTLLVTLAMKHKKPGAAAKPVGKAKPAMAGAEG